MSTNKNVILGYSGHAYVVMEAANKMGISISYYADKVQTATNPFGLAYLGFEGDDDFKGWYGDYRFILGVGDNMIRERLAVMVNQKGKALQKIIHPTSEISSDVELGDGTFVAAQVAVNPLAQVGKFVILNTASVIEHECIINDGVHIAPGAVLAGNVSVGKRSFIGANAVIKEGVTIGDDVIVGAGSTIINDIADQQKVVGNPGHLI